MLKARIALILLLCLCSSQAAAEKVDLVISFMKGDQNQRAAMLNLLRDFHDQHPGIRVLPIDAADSEYKEKIIGWAGSGEADVLYWQAGNRLCHLQQHGDLLDIGELWNSSQLDMAFADPVRDLVSCGGEVYGMPFMYYHWGFYYRKSLFDKWGLKPPRNWEEFVHLATTLKEIGIKPIGLSSKNYWPVAAWFDYLNLRINGLEFHRNTLSGKVAFSDQRLLRVFQHWKTLLDAGLVSPNHKEFDVDSILPFVFNGRIGMTLSGNFVSTKLPSAMREEIGFFPFPEIESAVPVFEIAPTEVFVISRHSRQLDAAKAFVRFISHRKNQETLATELKQLSPRVDADHSSDYLTQAGLEVLRKAEGYAQFFDRDTDPVFAHAALKIFRDFIDKPDIAATVAELEKARGRVFGKALELQASRQLQNGSRSSEAL